VQVAGRVLRPNERKQHDMKSDRIPKESLGAVEIQEVDGKKRATFDGTTLHDIDPGGYGPEAYVRACTGWAK
jgi:hypothetical protein